MQTNLVISVLGGCGLWTFYSLLVKRYPNLERNIYTILSIGSVLFGARQAVSLVNIIIGIPTFYHYERISAIRTVDFSFSLRLMKNTFSMKSSKWRLSLAYHLEY